MTYESEILLDWYLLFHYGSPDQILDGVPLPREAFPPAALEFPLRTVEFFQRADSLPRRSSEEPVRALDLGCAVGRSSFALEEGFADEVIAIDFSRRFVETAEAIRDGRIPSCRRYSEGHLSERITLDFEVPPTPGRIRFEVGDAMTLRDDLGVFDLVHAANLLCRLPRPQLLLERLPDLVRPGGLLVLATPATWMEEYTPREHQPPGPTLDYLREHLGGGFEFLEAEELPFLIREHARKIQLSTAQTSLWRRV